MKDLKIGYAPVDFAERAEPATRPAFAAAIAVLKIAGRAVGGDQAAATFPTAPCSAPS